MPTFLFLKEGKLVNKVVGGNKTELNSGVDKYSIRSQI